MKTVTVTAIRNFHDGTKMVHTGDDIEVSEDRAKQLKGNGLVDGPIDAAPPRQGEKIFVSDKQRKAAPKETPKNAAAPTGKKATVARRPKKEITDTGADTDENTDQDPDISDIL